MEVEQQYGDQVRFVGVPGLADVEAVREFIADTGVAGLDHIPDEAGEIWERFGVTRQRTYVFINDDGTTRRTGYGSLADDVRSLIEQ